MIQYLSYKVARILALFLPLKLGYLLALIIAVLRYKLSTMDRRALINNLKVVLNTDDRTLLKKSAREVFINFAKYLVDFFRFSILNKDFIKKFVKVNNVHFVDEAFKKGQGVIVLTAHIGNWELAGAVTSLLGYPVNVIALSHKHKRVNDFFVRQRESKGVKVIPLGAAVKKSFACLFNNEMIGLLGDRDFTRGGIYMEFLGKHTRIPKGPATFSLKSKAPIIPAFMIREEDGTFTYTFENPIEPYSTGKMEQDLRDITGKFVAVIEKYIRHYPTQWFMFREFWTKNANAIY